MSVDFLSLIERGRNAPSFETLDRIAKKLKLAVADLFTFSDGLR
jgi:transcriptional regulator with XRE-family HTH domain